MSDSLKVLVLHWGQSGAGPRLTLELSRALAARDDTSVCVSYRKNTELDSELEEMGLPSMVVNTYRTKLGALLNIPRFLRNVLSLRRFMARQQTTIVVSPMFSLWQNLALPFIIGREVRLVATIHDATEHPGDEHVLKRMCQALEIRYATRIVCFSQHVKDVLTKTCAGAPPIDVTVLGSLGGNYSAVRRRAPDTDQTIVVGFFGRLLPYKGLELFVEAIDGLGESGWNVRGEVWGNGDEDYVTSLPSSQHVRLHLGWVEESATTSVVSGFDVLALPYLEASQSGVLTIAMSQGVPVVATPVAGLVEQVLMSKCGLLADEVSSNAFADAVASLLSDKSVYENLSANGIESARNAFSWERVGHDYTDSFRHALG